MEDTQAEDTSTSTKWRAKKEIPNTSDEEDIDMMDVSTPTRDTPTETTIDSVPRDPGDKSQEYQQSTEKGLEKAKAKRAKAKRERKELSQSGRQTKKRKTKQGS